MRYLLGTLSEEERARLEERYFSDDKEFEEIEIAEDELIDRYVRGELTGTDLKQFEQAVALSPRLMERIEFAKLFAVRLRPAEAPVVAPVKPSWWERFFGVGHGSQLALACSVALVLLAFGVSLYAWVKLREESRRLETQQAALEQRQRELNQQAAELAQRPRPTPTETRVPFQGTVPQPSVAPVALTLFPGGARSLHDSKDLRLFSKTSDVEVTLNLRNTDYSSYRVKLNSVDRQGLLSISGLKPRITNNGSMLTFRIPAQRLPKGDFYISLFGEPADESVDDYPFRVIR
ncbi:MAG TPA: anti-sigma factor [Pyrinomonadaceae bacterium]|jgi:hypothetical protein|nr:anti-sigma factor [Pyrinomonadaceae bacterium]